MTTTSTHFGLNVGSLPSNQHWLISVSKGLCIDTVGNCSVIDFKPSAHAGMKILGDKGGYASKGCRYQGSKGIAKRQMQGHRGIGSAHMETGETNGAIGVLLKDPRRSKSALGL